MVPNSFVLFNYFDLLVSMTIKHCCCFCLLVFMFSLMSCLSRHFNTPFWHNVFDQLLNANGWVDLDQLKAHLLSVIKVSNIKPSLNSAVPYLARRLLTHSS